MESKMRFNTAFIDFARARRYAPGSQADLICRAIVERRRALRLDEKFPAGNPWNYDDNTLEYEFEKLGTVFEAVRRHGAVILGKLGEIYSPAEVEEIVGDYFPELIGWRQAPFLKLGGELIENCCT
jgi:hypothetical protein